METFEFFVEKSEENIRLDLFLTEEFKELSRTAVQKLIDAGDILVNAKAAGKNYKLKKGDFIAAVLKEPVAPEILPENIKLNVVFEDSELIVVNKPQGMVVHPSPGHYSGTLVNALLYHCGEGLSGINGVIRPGIVHRIDKDTSGLLVAAKTNNAHIKLAGQLAEHTVTRAYNAVCHNNIKEDEGTVDKPIGRNPNDRKKMAVTEKNSKRALTHYKVLERFGKYTMFEARLETGRTHQIRVHMAYKGYPLLGDMVYGVKKQPFNLAGQVLHAKILGFCHPVNGRYMEFESENPEYFIKLIDKLRFQ